MKDVPQILTVGLLLKSINYGEFKIIAYRSSLDIDIQFVLTGYTYTTQSSHIRRGLVKDKYYPKYSGKGYIGEGTYTTKHPAQSVWANMLRRCYDETCAHYPNYGGKGVSVCSEWHNYQVFAEWFNLNYVQGYELDKDILSLKNKCYSPRTCIFVSPMHNRQAMHNTLGEEYYLQDKEGKMHHFTDQVTFAKQYALDTGALSRVIRGKRKSHKGFMLIKNHDKAKK